MSQKRILIWYRNDLRLHDHEPLCQALQAGAIAIPCYCFDPRQFGQTSYGFAKTGAYRGQFLLESLADLRASLRQLGSELILRRGLPEVVIATLVREGQIEAVYYHQEVTSEERRVERCLGKALRKLGVDFRGFWGVTLYHPQDLPFAIEEIPELYTNFRKQVEKKSRIRLSLPVPTQISPLPAFEPGELPDLAALGLAPPSWDERAVLRFCGGEREGLKRLDHYFWQQDRLKTYKETRNGLLGEDYSSKFSPWLALGSLSPRYIYEQVQAYEEQRVRNDSTYWLVFELIWRDFFRFIAVKQGDRLFRLSGLQGIEIAWQEDWERFERWQRGKTGYPLVDANMREIGATGYLSNRGRQNVASFLTKNLGINWQMGAQWFESLLVDYDVCSNWGNWNYTAGVGNDARGFRYFNIPKQSRDYDPKGEYIKHWLPELGQIPGDKIYEPGKLTLEEQKRYQVILGVDYPRPIVDFFKSLQANEAVYNAAVARSKSSATRPRS